MNTLGAGILTVLMLMVLFAPRRWALLGMMAGVLYLTQGEKIAVFGLNLFALRFLEVAGFTRIMLRREFSFSSLNEIDRAFLWLYIYTTVVFLLRSTEGQAYQIGIAVDAILCYFTFRGLIENIADLRWFLRSLLILLVPYVTLLIIESMSNHNFFAIVGGSTEAFGFRNGRPRCLGSFRNPDLLGTLGASFLPLYIGLAFAKPDRIRALLGVSLCLGIVWLTNSGGPVSAAALGVVGWLFWELRMNMALVRRAIVGFMVLVALFMKAPIWYLPMKLSSITGGHGWHRSYLMDMAFSHLAKWWLAGMPIKDTADWFPYTIAATGGADITNQYIRYGITAGLVAIGLFIFLLIQAFRKLGKAMSAVRLGPPVSTGTEHLLWGIGVMLTVHVVNWIGISYFDQIYVVWFMQLSIISSLSQEFITNLAGEQKVG